MACSTGEKLQQWIRAEFAGRREYADERSEANEAGADAVKPAPPGGVVCRSILDF